MANYAANARTNAFFIDSIEGLTASLAQYGLTVSEEPHIADLLIDAGAIREDGAQSVKLFAYGGWPTMGEDSVAERLELARRMAPCQSDRTAGTERDRMFGEVAQVAVG